MNKKRKYEPNQWSWTSKLYNASSIAQKATEQAEQVELMENGLKRARKSAIENQEYCKLLETSIKTWESSHSQLEKKLQKSKELYASLLAENEYLKTRQITKEAENETLKSQLNAIKKELHSVKRECNENKARKKSWKKKYEELANMGATALAKITHESYGVSPEQFQAYKKLAATQFEVDKAEQERLDALKMLHGNSNALEDKK